MKTKITILLALYATILAGQALYGIGEASYRWGICGTNLARIELVFPGVRIGCWLGQPLEK